MVWLRIADSGNGVAPQNRKKLFDAYFTTKAEGTGTGLGLAVSRSIARAHLGDLVLEPTATGASFLLTLPFGAKAARAAAPTSPIAPALETLAHVLVVDDEPEIVDLIRTVLERAKYRVTTADSGATALKNLSTTQFDAAVCDLHMPNMDGEALWQAVSGIDPRLAGRMLFVTGDTLSPSVQRFFQNAARHSLPKPFSNQDLLEKLAQILKMD